MQLRMSRRAFVATLAGSCLAVSGAFASELPALNNSENVQVPDFITKGMKTARGWSSWDDNYTLVPVGEPCILSNPDQGLPFVFWDGQMEVTVLGAELFDSPEEAAAAVELGRIGREVEGRLLVVRVRLRNIDAQPHMPSEYGDFQINSIINAQYITVQGKDSATTGEPCTAPTLLLRYSSFDGANEECADDPRHWLYFELAPGEVREFTVGFEFPQPGTEPTSPAEPLELFFRPTTSGSRSGPYAFALTLGTLLEKDRE